MGQFYHLSKKSTRCIEVFCSDAAKRPGPGMISRPWRFVTGSPSAMQSYLSTAEQLLPYRTALPLLGCGTARLAHRAGPVSRWGAHHPPCPGQPGCRRRTTAPHRRLPVRWSWRRTPAAAADTRGALPSGAAIHRSSPEDAAAPNGGTPDPAAFAAALLFVSSSVCLSGHKHPSFSLSYV